MAGVYKEMLDSTVQLDEAQLGTLTEAFNGAMTDMIDGMVVKGYSRDTEFEADKVGIRILAEAGYDPQAFISVLEQIDAKVGGNHAGGFGATHPSAKDRIAKLKSEAAKLGKKTVPSIRVDRFKAAVAEL
jgi:predicted Zn-dependent protease